MTRLLRISQVSVTALVLATVSSQAAVTTITLDDYRDMLPAPLLVNSVVTSASSGVQVLSVPSLAGTQREIDLAYVSGPSSGEAATLTSPGRLSLSNGPGGFGQAATVATLTAGYDLAGALDFTLGGGDSFAVDIHSRDPAVEAEIAVSITSVGMVTAMATAPFTLAGTVQAIPFTAFAGVDFTQVTGFSITINPQPAFDGSIRLIGVTGAGVPEPSGSVALLAILAGVVARRRRQ